MIHTARCGALAVHYCAIGLFKAERSDPRQADQEGQGQCRRQRRQQHAGDARWLCAGIDRRRPNLEAASAGLAELTLRVVSSNLRFVQTYRTDGLAALADPTRREIFERIATRPRAVGELAQELPVSRPAVSQHLKVLKEARLVAAQQEGTRRIYQLDPEGVQALRTYLDHFWDQSLAAFKAAAEQPNEETP